MIFYTESMGFFFLQNLLTGAGQQRSLTFAGILLTCLLVGCDNSDSDTFIRFQVEGKSYVVEGATLTVTHMPFDLRFFDLTYPHKRLIPGAMIQWRMKMKLKSVEELVGQNLDLKAVDPNHIEPVAIFRMTQDLSMQGQQHSNIHFKIDRIENGFVEGSFSGKDLQYVSGTNELTGKVDVTAQFRAKFVHKSK
jgi:hypothetical protein